MKNVKIYAVTSVTLFLTMCVPPEGGSGMDLAKEKEKLDKSEKDINQIENLLNQLS